MAKDIKKKKPNKVRRVADATADLICEVYQSFRDNPDFNGKKFDGKVPLSEPLKRGKHGEIRLLLMENLQGRRFKIFHMIVIRQAEVDVVDFCISRNDS